MRTRVGQAGGGMRAAGEAVARRGRRRPAAFTLIELLLAITLSSLLISATVAVLFTSLRLRNQAERRIDASDALHQALATLRRDLANMALPASDSANPLAGALVYGGITGINDPAGTGMQLFATTGIVQDASRWPDIVKVGYVLRMPTNATPTVGRNLHRVVTRNLLPVLAETFDDQLLLPNVESFQLSFFDGSTWRVAWGGTNEVVAMPRAVRVDVVVNDIDPADLAAGRLGNATRLPFQLVVPILVTPSTNTTAAASAGSGGGGP